MEVPPWFALAQRVSPADLSPPLRRFLRDDEDGVRYSHRADQRFVATTEPALSLRSEWVRGGRVAPLARVFLRGAVPVAYSPATGEGEAFRVRLAPTAPLALFGVRDLGERVAPVRALSHVVRPALVDAVTRYEAGLRDCANHASRVALTERLLRDVISRSSDADAADAAFLDAAIATIEAAHGCLRIGDLAHRMGVSRPTLRRRFGVLGLSIKRFSDLVRYRHAEAYLRATTGATWIDAVDRFGYCDQSHFLRARRRFSGASPAPGGAQRAAVPHFGRLAAVG